MPAPTEPGWYTSRCGDGIVRPFLIYRYDGRLFAVRGPIHLGFPLGKEPTDWVRRLCDADEDMTKPKEWRSNVDRTEFAREED